MNRRTAIQLGAAGAFALATSSMNAQSTPSYKVKNGRIRQSVVPWCFNPMPLAELAKLSAALGISSVELCDPKDWPMLKELGLTCALAGSHMFDKGFAHRDEWDECLAVLRPRIEECAAAGVERVITFSGYRKGISDEEGIKTMVEGLKKIIGHAEKHKVTICLEMLNSRDAAAMKGHPDYFCDDINRTVEVCKQVGSERMKVLFDLYHVQIMHGDVIRRIHECKDYIAHVHTAGVPGRNEIDDTQELNYAPLMKALLDVGYKGFVGQEFIPLRDKAASLTESVRICDV